MLKKIIKHFHPRINFSWEEIMALKISLNYSPNFNSFKRKKNKVKFLIIHYTGMKSEKQAIDRLKNIQSQVSAHYLIMKKVQL